MENFDFNRKITDEKIKTEKHGRLTATLFKTTTDLYKGDIYVDDNVTYSIYLENADPAKIYTGAVRDGNSIDWFTAFDPALTNEEHRWLEYEFLPADIYEERLKAFNDAADEYYRDHSEIYPYRNFEDRWRYIHGCNFEGFWETYCADGNSLPELCENTAVAKDIGRYYARQTVAEESEYWLGLTEEQQDQFIEDFYDLWHAEFDFADDQDSGCPFGCPWLYKETEKATTAQELFDSVKDEIRRLNEEENK